MDFFQLTQEDSITTQTKCDMLKEIIEQIACLIEDENYQGSTIRLHVITFNVYAHTYSKNDTPYKQFIEEINLYPSDCTDFRCARKKYDKLAQTFTSDNISLFLSDGKHNSGDRNLVLDQPYDYTVGVGDDLDLDVDNLQGLGKEYFQSTNKTDIENFIIGSIFSGVQSCFNNVSISIYVPSYVELDTNDEMEYTLHSYLPKDEGTMSFTVNFSRSNDTVGLSIAPIFIHNVVENLDVTLIVDESASMDERIHSEARISIPSPDICNYEQQNCSVQSPESQSSDIRIMEEENAMRNDEFNTNIDQVMYNHISDVYTDVAQSVFDTEPENNSYGRRYVKYTFNIDKMDRYYKLFTVLNNTTSGTNVVIEIDNNDVITRKKYNIGTTMMYTIRACEEIVKIERAINKIVNMEKCKLRKEYIRELYAYISNEEYKDDMESELRICCDMTEKHKYNTLISHVNMLYDSIMTVGERGHEYYNGNNLGSLQREVSTRICRELTQSQQSQSEAITVNDKAIEVEKDCIICYDHPKSIIYNCGHMVNCKSCAMRLLFEDFVDKPAIYNTIQSFPYRHCPLCKEKITGYVELQNNDFNCCISGCVMPPTIICCKCKKLIYCKSCWNNKIRKVNRSKKRKRIVCTCGEDMEKYIEAIY